MILGKVSNWAAQFVLKYTQPEQRAAVLTKLIDVPHECRKLNNFETVVQIMSGIETSPISRLKLSWALVSDRSTAKLNELRNLFDPQENWKVYRRTGPCRPPRPPLPRHLSSNVNFCRRW